MNIDQLAPEKLNENDHITVSISLSKETYTRLNRTVEALRDAERRINRSKLIENLCNEGLDRFKLI